MEQARIQEAQGRARHCGQDGDRWGEGARLQCGSQARSDNRCSNVAWILRGNGRTGFPVSTDGSSSYRKPWEYTQDAVNHGAGEFVRGSVHTSSIEEFWSLFKRGYYGIQYRMTIKHLYRYLDEFTGRVGIRGMDTIDQMGHIVLNRDGKVLMYKRLTV